ncbi:MAG: hypothetical protein ING68_03415 [Rhodocyclaceae bacterium]|jgi:hypothetical protein|nr:hypothetical protein [Rhodocyclaceae bacterium]MCA3021201.1 hypothetical protein [Rhodocyclaceae bacterium]MCA3052389.1 hypothetical protein [Rhodocyclaceae bacterium]
MPTVIDETLELIGRCTPVQRWNIRTLYLAQFGDAIVPHCINHFRIQPQAEVRSDLLRFLIRYARDRDDVVALAIMALRDRSRVVRESACAVLAYSFADRAVATLQEIVDSGKQPTATSARNAILAISARNHNLYYPTYEEWFVSEDDPNQPKDEDVAHCMRRRLFLT